MTDAPTLCIPPDPSISGWWWLHDGYDVDGPRARQWNPDPTYNGGGWWSVWACEPWSSEAIAREGFRILGPVTTHAEVEALRAEIQRLRKALQAVKDAAAYVDGSLTDCGNIAGDALNGGTTP
jgi:hypothetical protein